MLTGHSDGKMNLRDQNILTIFCFFQDILLVLLPKIVFETLWQFLDCLFADLSWCAVKIPFKQYDAATFFQ